MNIAILGYGSIGKKHAQNLESLSVKPIIISTHSTDEKYPTYKSVEEATKHHQIDTIWICNQTNLHISAIQNIDNLGFKGRVLVEKPLGDEFQELKLKNISELYITYNLRFLKTLSHLKSLLAGKNICSISAYVGQYLPSWRKDSDYKKSYSASKESQGGVIRDLSHEIDYLMWIAGPATNLISKIGLFSDLEISSEDHCSVIFETSLCPLVSLNMNYIDHRSQRRLIINTNEKTYSLDFIKGELWENNSQIMTESSSNSYLTMTESLIQEDFSFFCSKEQAVQIQQFVKATEKSSEEKRWIKL